MCSSHIRQANFIFKELIMQNISALVASMPIYQKFVVDLDFDTSWAKPNPTVNHIQEVSNRVHNDGLVTDPFWINGVNVHASLSRHNYTSIDPTVKIK